MEKICIFIVFILSLFFPIVSTVIILFYRKLINILQSFPFRRFSYIVQQQFKFNINWRDVFFCV